MNTPAIGIYTPPMSSAVAVPLEAFGLVTDFVDHTRVLLQLMELYSRTCDPVIRREVEAMRVRLGADAGQVAAELAPVAAAIGAAGLVLVQPVEGGAA